MMRSQTDEQLAAKWDPKPWRNVDTGERSDNGNPDGRIGTRYTFDPRPECIPSRIWDDTDPDGFVRYRPEAVRPPVNPILVAFRLFVARHTGMRLPGAAEDWLAFGDPAEDGATPEQLDHARKVLTRLATLS